ncbi:MAG: hypothetical protein OEU94_13850, partial [Aquincola sp.]|nr:hypothetical protein [Aquincola sp.]
MKTVSGFCTISRHAIAVTMVAVLAACGGGGGGGGGSPALIDLTAANRDSVARAAASSVMSLGVSTSIPVLSGGSPVGMLWRTVTGTERERPLAVFNGTVACDISGYATVTLNDLNGDAIFNV